MITRRSFIKALCGIASTIAIAPKMLVEPTPLTIKEREIVNRPGTGNRLVTIDEITKDGLRILKSTLSFI